MSSHLALQLTSGTIICHHTRRMHPAACYCPMPSHLFPCYGQAEAVPFIPSTASFQGSITGSTDLFVGVLFTPPFFCYSDCERKQQEMERRRTANTVDQKSSTSVL